MIFCGIFVEDTTPDSRASRNIPKSNCVVLDIVCTRQKSSKNVLFCNLRPQLKELGIHAKSTLQALYQQVVCLSIERKYQKAPSTLKDHQYS
jgi:GTPase Era involved in 16S rRNA processing